MKCIWDDNNIRYFFEVDNNNTAFIYGICRSGNQASKKTLKIPAKVQHNGVEYPVTRVGGIAYDKMMTTDKRSRYYGKYQRHYDHMIHYDYCGKPNHSEERYNEKYNIEKVILPNTIEKIEAAAFYGFKSLTKVELNEGVQVIGESAFAYCSSLKTITIPSSVKQIESWCFNGGNPILLKIKNNAGSIVFGPNALDSKDRVEYVGTSTSLFSKLFK